MPLFVDPARLMMPLGAGQPPPPPAAMLNFTGTIFAATAADIIAGGRTLVGTLTGATWAATIGDNNALTTALLDGIAAVAAGGGADWNGYVRPLINHAHVTRDSDTIVRIVLPAAPAYLPKVEEQLRWIAPEATHSAAADLIAPEQPTIAVAQFYVSQNGNDTTGTGTKALPWATLGHAFAQQTAANTIFAVERGSTIPEAATKTPPAAGVQVRDYGAGALPVLTQASRDDDNFLINTANCTLFQLSGVGGRRVYEIQHQGVRVIDCDGDDSFGHVVRFNGLAVTSGLVDGGTFSRSEDGSGVSWVNGAQGTTVQNTTTRLNFDGGYEFQDSSGGGHTLQYNDGEDGKDIISCKSNDGGLIQYNICRNANKTGVPLSGGNGINISGEAGYTVTVRGNFVEGCAARAYYTLIDTGANAGPTAIVEENWLDGRGGDNDTFNATPGNNSVYRNNIVIANDNSSFAFNINSANAANGQDVTVAENTIINLAGAGFRTGTGMGGMHIDNNLFWADDTSNTNSFAHRIHSSIWGAAGFRMEGNVFHEVTGNANIFMQGAAPEDRFSLNGGAGSDLAAFKAQFGLTYAEFADPQLPNTTNPTVANDLRPANGQSADGTGDPARKSATDYEGETRVNPDPGALVAAAA